MEGGGSPIDIDWAALAPHIDYPTREYIAEMLRWVGPLSALEPKCLLDEPEHHLTCVRYHATAMAREEKIYPFAFSS
jgi:hypothetical protein